MIGYVPQYGVPREQPRVFLTLRDLKGVPKPVVQRLCRTARRYQSLVRGGSTPFIPLGLSLAMQYNRSGIGLVDRIDPRALRGRCG